MNTFGKKFYFLVLSFWISFLLMSPSSYALRFSRSKAPSFSETDIQGNRHSLRRYRGSHLVLYFWATWCPACRQEVRNIERLYEEYHPKGVSFVSVSLDVDLEKLEKFVQEKGISYPVLFDGKAWQNKIARAYGIGSTPSYILVDPDGIIEGVGSWSRELEEDLKAIISER